MAAIVDSRLSITRHQIAGNRWMVLGHVANGAGGHIPKGRLGLERIDSAVISGNGVILAPAVVPNSQDLTDNDSHPGDLFLFLTGSARVNFVAVGTRP